MRTIKWEISMGLVGCKHEGEFEIEDDASKDEIEETARQDAFDRISWTWWEQKPNENYADD